MKVFNDIEVLQDKDARTLTYYITSSDFVRVNDSLIKELTDLSVENGKSNARINLHTSPDASFHEMIIVEYAGQYYRPHKHSQKGESIHVLVGQAAMFIFDDDGLMINHSIMGEGADRMCRTGANVWHDVIPLSESVVYIESKPGPYVRETNNVFAPWAPNGSNNQEAQEYMQQLLSKIGV